MTGHSDGATFHPRHSPCCAEEALRWLRSEQRDPVDAFIRDELSGLLARTIWSKPYERLSYDDRIEVQAEAREIVHRIAELRK